MAISYKQFTLGVEEEYMVLDPLTHELKSHEQKIVQEGQKIIMDKVKAEMSRRLLRLVQIFVLMWMKHLWMFLPSEKQSAVLQMD